MHSAYFKVSLAVVGKWDAALAKLYNRKAAHTQIRNSTNIYKQYSPRKCYGVCVPLRNSPTDNKTALRVLSWDRRLVTLESSLCYDGVLVTNKLTNKNSFIISKITPQKILS